MQKYLIAFIPDNGSFSLFSPDFPEFNSCGDNICDATLMAQDCLRVCVEEYHKEGRAIPEPCDMQTAKERITQTLDDIKFTPDGEITWYQIPVETEEQFSPAEYWLAMTLTLRDDECPYAYFPRRKADMPFCEGSVKENDDEYYLECPKFKGNGWVRRIGECWLLYSKQQAKSASPQEIEEQVWKERCEDRN